MTLRPCHVCPGPALVSRPTWNLSSPRRIVEGYTKYVFQGLPRSSMFSFGLFPGVSYRIEVYTLVPFFRRVMKQS